MILYKCLVNGAIAQSAREQVRQGLARIHSQMFGLAPDAIAVEFTEVKPGLWFTGGSFSQCRMYSRYVAMQIKAAELGIAPPHKPA